MWSDQLSCTVSFQLNHLSSISSGWPELRVPDEVGQANTVEDCLEIRHNVPSFHFNFSYFCFCKLWKHNTSIFICCSNSFNFNIADLDLCPCTPHTILEVMRWPLYSRPTSLPLPWPLPWSLTCWRMASARRRSRLPTSPLAPALAPPLACGGSSCFGRLLSGTSSTSTTCTRSGWPVAWSEAATVSSSLMPTSPTLTGRWWRRQLM